MKPELTKPLTLELPMPPSVNSIWRSKTNPRSGKPSFYLDLKYKRWKLVAEGVYWTMTGKTTFVGPVRVSVTLNEAKRRGDADNRLKAINDFLQRVGIVINDNQVVECAIKWGTAPKGCRVKVEAV